MWKLNNIVLKQTVNQEEITGTLENNLRLMKMKKKTPQNLWYTLKEVLRGKFMTVNTCLKKDQEQGKDADFHHFCSTLDWKFQPLQLNKKKEHLKWNVRIMSNSTNR